MYTFFRHTIKTTQVTAICDCKTKVIDGPVMVIEQIQVSDRYVVLVKCRSQNRKKIQTLSAKNSRFRGKALNLCFCIRNLLNILSIDLKTKTHEYVQG